MKSLRDITTSAVMCGLLSACANPLLAPDDRNHVCRVVVEEQFGSPIFHANVLASPAGGLVGAGQRALLGFNSSILAIFTVPIGAAIGAAASSACVAASLNHPAAEADFERLIRATDTGVLKRTLEVELNAPRPECDRAYTDGSTSSVPDTIVEILKIESGMSCAFDPEEYWIAAQWKTIDVKTQRTLNLTTTRCVQTSSRNVDDWFANQDQAQAEIEQALAGTGKRVAAQLLAQEQLPLECRLRLGETDGAKAR